MSQGEVVESAFAPVPERGAYVPRPASEAALAALEASLAAGERVIALRGPVGMGKSLLLRLLEGRLAPGYDVLHVAPGALPLADLLAFALGSRATRPGPAGGPEATLVLPVDDAQALSPSTARGLAGLVKNAEGALRLVLAFDEAIDPALTAALGGAPREVRLDAPLSPAEVAHYVDARLQRAGAPEALRRRLVAAESERLHALSEGNPGRLNRLAAELAAAPEVTSARSGDAVGAAAPRLPSLAALPRDPFGPSATASLYQARSFTERILGGVERELLRGRRAVLLRGPGGIGKTTLLRVLEARLRDPYQLVALPYARLAPDEFFGFVLHQLGAPRSAAPEGELLAIARRLAALGNVLVLLLDDAPSIPAATGVRLAALLESGGGALRAILTADDEAPAGDIPALPDAAVLRVDEPLAPPETEAYLLGRLLHFDAPIAVRRRFDARTIAALHRDSAGLPRELNRLAGEIERQALAPPPLPPPPAPTPTAPPRGAAPPAASPGVAPTPPAAPAPSPAAARPGWLPFALGLLPHVGLGLGIPLALLALWLWLAPLFSRGH